MFIGLFLIAHLEWVGLMVCIMSVDLHLGWGPWGPRGPWAPVTPHNQGWGPWGPRALMGPLGPFTAHLEGFDSWSAPGALHGASRRVRRLCVLICAVSLRYDWHGQTATFC